MIRRLRTRAILRKDFVTELVEGETVAAAETGPCTRSVVCAQRVRVAPYVPALYTLTAWC